MVTGDLQDLWSHMSIFSVISVLLFVSAFQIGPGEFHLQLTVPLPTSTLNIWIFTFHVFHIAKFRMSSVRTEILKRSSSYMIRSLQLDAFSLIITIPVHHILYIYNV